MRSVSGSIYIPSLSLQNYTISYTNPTVTTTEAYDKTIIEFVPDYVQGEADVMAVKTVQASTGSINSQYGIIQSIS